MKRLMDSDYVLDLEEVIEKVENAEVMSLYFPTFGKALVVDTRFSEKEGPLVRIMRMVASPQERIRSIRRLRPGFPRPRSLTLIAWPRYVDSLVSLGIWDRVVQRLVQAGNDEAAALCEAVLGELRRLEKAGLAAVVLGEDYHTVWSSRQ